MTNNSIVFDVGDEGEEPPHGYKEMTANVVFDIKLDFGFTCKEGFVADGHKFYTPSSMMYSYVVSRDNVWIVLILKALNGIDLNCYYAQNEYLDTKHKEKVWFWDGQGFGVHQGKAVVVVRSLYSLKGFESSWAS